MGIICFAKVLLCECVCVYVCVCVGVWAFVITLVIDHDRKKRQVGSTAIPFQSVIEPNICLSIRQKCQRQKEMMAQLRLVPLLENSPSECQQYLAATTK